MLGFSKHRVVQLATVLVVLLVLGQPAIGAHGAQTNATVYFLDTPKPGATEVSMWSSTISQFPERYEDETYEGNISLVWTPLVTSPCQFENLEEFGIDRGNTNPNWQTDESAIPYTTNGSYTETGVEEYQDETSTTDWDYVEKVNIYWNNPNDTTSPNLQMNDGDQFIAKQDSCYALPDEAGWYRDRQEARGVLGDRTPKEYVTDSYYSHWYYICDCESYDEAIETIGPPPSEGGESTTQTPSNDEAQPTPTATMTATPSDEGSTATATATETATATSQVDETTEPTDRGSESSGGDGPGFGIIATLMAALAAALIARRHN